MYDNFLGYPVWGEQLDQSRKWGRCVCVAQQDMSHHNCLHPELALCEQVKNTVNKEQQGVLISRMKLVCLVSHLSQVGLEFVE